MKMDLNQFEERFSRIEDTLETIQKNHLHHIEKYTKWTLIGVLVSTSASLLAVTLTVL